MLFVLSSSPDTTETPREEDLINVESIEARMKFWAPEFQRGRKSLEDDERSRRPNTETTDENIAKVHQMVLDDSRIKVREIAEVMNMSNERLCHILNQHLGMRKLSMRRMPHLLTLDQKRVSINISNDLLAEFRRNKS
ncbi:histone-lysine N-methyltransferase SETMAR [Trichonephila clavipes]|nr:histone-lysine N-methyltransferase SETMAR [Trichonephila clavipes]